MYDHQLSVPWSLKYNLHKCWQKFHFFLACSHLDKYLHSKIDGDSVSLARSFASSILNYVYTTLISKQTNNTILHNLFVQTFALLSESRAICKYLGTDLLRSSSFTESSIVDEWMEAEAHRFLQSLDKLLSFPHSDLFRMRRSSELNWRSWEKFLMCTRRGCLNVDILQGINTQWLIWTTFLAFFTSWRLLMQLL